MLVQYGKVIWARVKIYFGITFLLYIQLFKENATFKLHFVLIVKHVKQQNVTYFRFLNYMHLPLKRTSSYKNTHTVIDIPKQNKLMTRSCRLASTNACCILSYCITFIYSHFVKDGVHTAERGIWIIDVCML